MKNNFDDILREKWEEKFFPVDDHHRQQMLDLLEANARRKNGIIWWLGGLVLAVTIGGIILFINQDSTTTGPSTPVPFNSLHNTDELMQIPNGSVKATNNYTPGSDNDPQGKDNSTQILNNNAQRTNDAEKRSAKHKKITNHVTQSTNDSDNGVKGPTSNNRIYKVEGLIQYETSPIISETVEIKVNTASDEQDDYRIVTAQRNTFVTLPLESFFFSKITSQHSNITGYIKPSFSNIHSFRLFAEAGAGYIPAVKQAYSSGWNLMAGGGLAYKIGSKTNLLLSAGYMLQNGGFDFERTSTVQQPGFGTRSNFNTLTPDKLHFVYSNLGVQYEVRRHLFSVHGGLQWLYGAQGTIVIRTADQFAVDVESTQYTWLKTDGMRRFLWNGEALYGYRVTPCMSIRVGVKYYFSSIDINNSSLTDAGYYWNGHYSSFTPSFIINYHLYGNR